MIQNNATLTVCLFAEHVIKSICDLPERDALAEKIREVFPDCLGKRFNDMVVSLKETE